MSTFKVETLSPDAIEVLGQLYVGGPVWDGNICSKTGREELIHAGLVQHMHGHAFLNGEGVRTAIEWDYSDLRKRGEERWLEKRRRS